MACSNDKMVKLLQKLTFWMVYDTSQEKMG